MVKVTRTPPQFDAVQVTVENQEEVEEFLDRFLPNHAYLFEYARGARRSVQVNVHGNIALTTPRFEGAMSRPFYLPNDHYYLNQGVRADESDWLVFNSLEGLEIHDSESFRVKFQTATG